GQHRVLRDAARKRPVAGNDELDDVIHRLSIGEDSIGFGLRLSPAELRVLAYLPTHLSLQEIADELILSRNTAKTHSVAIYRKLGVATRSEAVEMARQMGMLTEFPVHAELSSGRGQGGERPSGSSVSDVPDVRGDGRPSSPGRATYSPAQSTPPARDEDAVRSIRIGR
ncbi:MAG: response regulator transcription factor, partial [Acidimicrobiales bacterium]